MRTPTWSLREGGAVTIAAHGKWDHLVIAATLLHERDGVAPSSSRMLDVLERGTRSACESAADAGVRVLAATLIGDRRAGLAHNHAVTTSAAIEAMSRGFASANRRPTLRWCFVDEATAATAAAVVANTSEKEH